MKIDNEERKMPGFTGFKCFKYPIRSVICPMSGDTYEIRALRIDEIETLRSSQAEKNRIHSILNSVLWQCLVSKPQNISTYDDFIKHVCLEDKKALVYGLFIVTFGKLKRYILYCNNPSCKLPQETSVNLEEIMTFEVYPGNRKIINAYKVSKVFDKTLYDMEIEDYIKFIENETHKKIVRPSKDMPDNLVKSFYAEYYNIKKEFDEKKNETMKKVQDKLQKKIEEYEKAGKLNVNLTGGVVDSDEEERIRREEEKIIKEILEEENIENESSEEISMTQTEIDDILATYVETIKYENIEILIHSPKLIDEHELYDDVSLLQDDTHKKLTTDSLCIKEIIEYDFEGNVIQRITNRIDILLAFVSLVPEVQDMVYEVYENKFRKYSLNVDIKWECPRCKTKNRTILNPITQFFLAI